MTLFRAIAIIEGDAGLVSRQLTIKAWQFLIDSGEVWLMQGHYGRTARKLILDGVCNPPQIGEGGP